MRVNVLQHTPSEGPGSILQWAKHHHHEVFTYHPAQFGKLPSVQETDLLVILGSPQSPNDDFPWIKAERQLIKEMLMADKPIFGACFGAQQIAVVLGAKVHKAAVKEVGWAPVNLQSDVLTDFPQTATVLHWHEEMFELPEGAKLLFTSRDHQNQGFAYGDKVIGLQFHFEPDLYNLRSMVVNDGDYADEGNVLKQTADQILVHGVPKENVSLMAKLLDQIVNA
ncbi:type 1 glutamine amidotransferase [Lactobacillus sp. 3B(2020)]|uniref:type 1 glutamine amidotransferase n=1 Tax=Lactobacillus sp. 3B(2020) TaxID=2695882 RepID=UPI0015DFEB25|nr:type 1 glutamine amidotransferase [Lactobacillus sp. 3B(2020)]QLL69924.1 type 1 glutamine amidotransferase [Lactobacillus sp. 3B(2020)]